MPSPPPGVNTPQTASNFRHLLSCGTIEDNVTMELQLWLVIKLELVATQIKALNGKCLFTNCYGHKLNLAVGDSIKAALCLSETFEVVREICKLVKKSPQRVYLLQYPSGHFQLSSSCHVRSSARLIIC